MKFADVLVCGALAAVAGLGLAGPAGAWGSTGHRLVGRAAIEALPADLPPFLRGPDAVIAVGELSREPDRSKAAGKAHDADRDPGHFLDLGDDERVFGGPPITALPQTREDYETALRAVNSTSWKAGYLPYSIVECWQQLAKDLALWRADVAGARLAHDPAHRAWLQADRARREAQTLLDLGALSHFVGDGSQPLHVTIHYNGWGPFPNPNGYTLDKVHSPFEGDFVRAFVTPDAVRAHMTAPTDCNCAIEQRVGAYLETTGRTVIPFYELQKAGAFVGPNARGADFAAARLAAGASELRDLVVLAWKASASEEVGWKPVSVADVEAGKVDPYDSLMGDD